MNFLNMGEHSTVRLILYYFELYFSLALDMTVLLGGLL